MGRTTKYNEQSFKQVIHLAKQGKNNTTICKVVGISRVTFDKWIKNHKRLKGTLKRIRKSIQAKKDKTEKKIVECALVTNISSEMTFNDYVLGCLSSDMQDYWLRLTRLQQATNSIERIEVLMERGGACVRKTMFVHAWVTSNFNITKAMRMCNVSRGLFYKWKRDKKFQKLVDEIEWMIGNFYESALFDAVKMRDTSAILFANKTYNRKRGYNEKVEVELDVKDERGIDLSKLSIEARKEILKQIRENK